MTTRTSTTSKTKKKISTNYEPLRPYFFVPIKHRVRVVAEAVDNTY
jgi:hypothetical protein